jgi:hypothetical protein
MIIKISDSVAEEIIEEIEAMLKAKPPVPPEEFKDRIVRLVQRTQIDDKQEDLFRFCPKQLTIQGS